MILLGAMERFRNWPDATVLPLLLVALFVIQNIIFNIWTHLSPNPEFGFFLLLSITLGTLLFGPAVFFGKRMRFFYLFATSFFAALIFASQYLYFSFYGGFMQASALKYANQVGAEWSTILTLITPRMIFFFAGVLLVIFSAAHKRLHVYLEAVLPRNAKVFAASAIALIVILGYGTLIASGGDLLKKVLNPRQTLHDINNFVFSQNQTIQRTGIVNYYIGDLIGSNLRKVTITSDDIDFVEGRLANKEQHASNKYFGVLQGKNLIFVQVESLDAAVIGEKVGDKEVTPNLNRLAKEGLYFNNYYTQIGPGNTADAEFVTLTSLYPLTNTVAFIDFAHNNFSALPDLLRQNDYHTYALHGDVPNFWNRANIYPGLGYETQISKDAFEQKEEGFETLDDAEFLTQTAEKMSGFARPFMATAITLSSHTPFIIPDKYKALEFPADSPLSTKQQDYLQSVHYVDTALGAFIADLKARGIYNDSLIAIFGDHGSFTDTESQMRHDNKQTSINLTNSQVPLILLAKDLNRTMKGGVATPGSHLDLYPTVANLLGIATPQTIFGKDLLSTKNAVMTHRDPYTDVITNILTPRQSYESTNSGKFEDGTCTDATTNTILPITDCRDLYERQAENIRASDLIVKGNLLKRLSVSK